MVQIKISAHAAPARIAEIRRALESLKATTRAETGFLGSSVSLVNACIHYGEQWADGAAVRRRVRSDAFMALVALLESAKGVPHVEFHFSRERRGLEYVAEVRAVAPRD